MVDVAFLGPMVVRAECGVGVVAAGALVCFDPARAYLIRAGSSYVPLFRYSLQFADRVAAPAVLGDETTDTAHLFRKYRRQSLWILVPFAVAAAAFVTRGAR